MASISAGLASGLAATALACAAAAGQGLPPNFEFRVTKPPTVAVGDTTAFLAYELHVTNLTSSTFVLQRVEVVDSATRRVLHALEDRELLLALLRPGPAMPVTERRSIAAGMRATVFLWVPVDRAAPPRTVRHRLLLQRDSSSHVLQGAETPVNPDLVVIAPPLRGEWVAVNGPSNASGHRRGVLALSGRTTVPQRFGIDFLQLTEEMRTFRGDRSRNQNFEAYGKDVLAVANGVVVATKDSIPENVPGGRAVPITLETVGGNYIILDIGGGRFAFYAHLIPGSLRVKAGDPVRTGDLIGRVGNSGNSTEPHLHFHLSDAPEVATTTLGAEGLPYAHAQLEILGHCTITPQITCGGNRAISVRGAMPMQNQYVRFVQPAGRSTRN